jgi:hypothetical protein
VARVEAYSAAEALGLAWLGLMPTTATVHRDIPDLESRRRDFMADEPDLYAYIEARVAAREPGSHRKADADG